MNTELLQFLDGTISPDAEAELLHRLSVSPERRELLRSFINQQVLFQRDRNSIAVPYAAEQKLWSRLGEIMPPAIQNTAAPAVIESAATTVTRTRVFSSIFTAASVAVICLLIGIGSGYFIGKNNGNSIVYLTSPANTVSEPSGIQQSISPVVPVQRPLQNRMNSNHISQHNFASAAISNSEANSGAPQNNSSTNTIAQSVADISSVSDMSKTDDKNSAIAQISNVTPKPVAITIPPPAPSVGDPNHQYYQHSILNGGEDDGQSRSQRLEFSFNEALGKQYPNNSATNVSMPIITTSSISAIYQLSSNPNSVLNKLWIGTSFGNVNLTQIKYTIIPKDPSDPRQGYEMAADLVHQQTSFIGAMLQYRVPLSFIGAKWSAIANGSASYSSLGAIWGGELGAHFEATNNFGVIFGARATFLNYNLDAQQQQVISQGVSAFGIPAPVASQSKQQSHNMEFTSGIYFHF
jgi:hypothetical protein